MKNTTNKKTDPRVTETRELAGDPNRTALQFITTIDRLISGRSPSSHLWNYCVQYRASALKDAEKAATLRADLVAAAVLSRKNVGALLYKLPRKADPVERKSLEMWLGELNGALGKANVF